MSEENLEALRIKVELQEAELKKLRDQINPPPRQPSAYQPIDYTANATMPASALKSMLDAVPESVMHAIRGDAARPNPVNPPTPPQPQPQSQRKGGWIEPRPLEPPPGVALADRLMDHQDEIDRAELVAKLTKVEK